MVGQQHEVVLRAVALQERVVSHGWATRPSSHGRQRLLDTFRVVVPHPDDARVLAEPGVLPPGEPPRRHHGPLARLVERQLAVEVRRHLAVADRQAAVRPSRSPVAEQPLDLLDEARLEHRLDPRSIRSSRVGRSMSTPIWTVCGSAYSSRGSVAENGRPVISTTSSARTMRRPLSARMLPAAPGSTSASRRCSAAGPDLVQLGLEPAADGLVGARELEPVEHGPRVERRPADEHRHPLPSAHVGDRGARPLLELRDRQRLGDVEVVEQVVRDAAPLGDRQLRRADVHAAVDRHRVGVDDLAAERLGQVERQVALARRRRADDGDDRGRRHGCSLPGSSRSPGRPSRGRASPSGAVEDPARPGFGGGRGSDQRA